MDALFLIPLEIVLFAVQVAISAIQWAWNNIFDLLIVAWGFGMLAIANDIRHECRRANQRLQMLWEKKLS
jgi:hypothetical protein